jgi:hypothetical protein
MGKMGSNRGVFGAKKRFFPAGPKKMGNFGQKWEV